MRYYAKIRKVLERKLGEAKRRKSLDPYYGMRPKLGRGIFLSAPMRFDGKTAEVSNDIDSAELRRAALFWDRLVWPDSRIVSVASNSDEKFLENAGILVRPRPNRFDEQLGIGDMLSLIRIEHGSNASIGGETGRLFAKEHIEEYLSLDQKEPGQWVLSEGEKSFYLENDNFRSGRGQLVTLANAIPLPSADFPINDLLEFKLKRSDEIIGLTSELDKFYSQVSNAADQNFELNRLIRVIDRHCADMIKVSKECKWKFHLGEVSYSLSVDAIESAFNRAVSWEAIGLVTTGLPLVGGALGGLASMVSFGRGIGARRLRDRSSPFKVVASIHKELVI
ncbi:DUF6236 family protein [Pseudotabrizicola sp. 4114]|uniref:DUF6236 family protein n=1 Tax=Pseudotabrizicola sp. 4114 TaxID=2817731 RepID=UPI00285C3A25|nr:hypothetical protein [Pseudorhodobacter sp. 4114]